MIESRDDNRSLLSVTLSESLKSEKNEMESSFFGSECSLTSHVE